jgi:cell division protein FtsZ
MTLDQSVLPFGTEDKAYYNPVPSAAAPAVPAAVVTKPSIAVIRPAEKQAPVNTPAQQPQVEDALQPRLVEEPVVREFTSPVISFTQEETSNITVDNSGEEKENLTLVSSVSHSSVPEAKVQFDLSENNSPLSAASGGYLAKPSNIYAEPANGPEPSSSQENSSPVNEPIRQQLPAMPQKDDATSFDMQLVIKDETPAADQPLAPSTQSSFTPPAEEPAMLDEVEEQKRKAAERIQKLRNLSFNINAADPNNEFDTVPAYIRRNLELYNTVSPAENFYSNYTVKTDEHNNTQISTINTFLDGKKPD